MCAESQPTPDELLVQAKAGSNECLGQLLQLYNNYLRLLALAQLKHRLRARVGPSDVVQETFFEAHRDFSTFRGTTTGEFLAWLRRILVNNLHRVIEKHVLAGKRDIRREISLEQLATALEQSTARLEAVFPDPGTSPGGRTERHELEVLVANQLALLSPDYRDVILFRHVEAMPFEQIARRMNRSSGAVRMLWLRALKQLRARLESRGL